jgi:hypothetical protein
VITLGAVFAGIIEKRAGAFPAAVIAPYAVRVVPNRVWRYLIPVYALGIAAASLFQLYVGDS